MGLKEFPKLEQEVTAYLGWDTQSSCGARASPDVVGQFPYFGRPCFHQLWRVKSKTNPKGHVKGWRDPDVQFHSPSTARGVTEALSSSLNFPGGCSQNQRVGATLPKPPRSPFQLGLFATEIFVM